MNAFLNMQMQMMHMGIRLATWLFRTGWWLLLSLLTFGFTLLVKVFTAIAAASYSDLQAESVLLLDKARAKAIEQLAEQRLQQAQRADVDAPADAAPPAEPTSATTPS